MEKQAVFKMVLDYFKENEDDFNDMIEELDSYNGYLGDDRYYEMDELYDLYGSSLSVNSYPSRNTVREARDSFENLLNRIYYGHDADTWHTDAHGEKEYGAFNPRRSYFTYNGYGNLISTDSKDYSDKLDDYFVESVYDNRQHLSLPNEVDELFELVEE